MTEQELIRDIIQSIDTRMKSWEDVLSDIPDLPNIARYDISGRLDELKEVREFLHKKLP